MLPVNSGPVVITTSLTELKEKLIWEKTFEDGLLDSETRGHLVSGFQEKNNISGKILFRTFTYQPDTMVAALAEWEESRQDTDTCTLHWPVFTGLCWTEFVKLFLTGIYLFWGTVLLSHGREWLLVFISIVILPFNC